MPASTSSSSSSRAAPYAKPAPRPRRAPSSTLAADPALDTLGALYIGWGGQQDPAPLCCAVQARASLVHRFGEAAVGYLTVQPQAQPLPKPQPRQPSSASQLASLPLGALPPLPPLPRRTSSTSSSSLSATPSLSATSSLSSSPGLTPAPPTPPSSSELFTFEDALNSSTKDAFAASTFDDTTLALPLVDSRPSSPRLAAPHALPPLAPSLSSGTSFVPTFSLSLASVSEYAAGGVGIAVKDEVNDGEGEGDDEALWSAGEDPLWNCGATDVMSEASWAW